MFCRKTFPGPDGANSAAQTKTDRLSVNSHMFAPELYGMTPGGPRFSRVSQRHPGSPYCFQLLFLGFYVSRRIISLTRSNRIAESKTPCATSCLFPHFSHFFPLCQDNSMCLLVSCCRHQATPSRAAALAQDLYFFTRSTNLPDAYYTRQCGDRPVKASAGRSEQSFPSFA
jgi:hypothetical protein